MLLASQEAHFDAIFSRACAGNKISNPHSAGGSPSKSLSPLTSHSALLCRAVWRNISSLGSRLYAGLETRLASDPNRIDIQRVTVSHDTNVALIMALIQVIVARLFCGS